MYRITALVFSILIVALSVEEGAAAQPACKVEDVWANGTAGNIQFTARRRARVAWLATVRGDLGQAYATWGIAKDRRTTCVRANRQYTCTVSARPCRT